MFPDPTLTLADQLFWIVDVFMKTMAPEACTRRIGLFSVAIWCRVKRFERRFSALYAQWKAGTLPAPRPSPARVGEGENARARGDTATGGLRPPYGGAFDPMACDAASVDRARTRPMSVLPRAFAWLHTLLPVSAPPIAGGVESLLLNYPEMRAFVAACPQVARMLRPICQMVGVKPPEYLALPTRKREPGLRRLTAAAPRHRHRRTPREIAEAAMRRAEKTGKPIDPRTLSAVPYGYVLHWPRDDNCPPPEIGYGGRSFPPLPKDYVRPKDWE